jgi:hypothetical protein
MPAASWPLALMVSLVSATIDIGGADGSGSLTSS